MSNAEILQRDLDLYWDSAVRVASQSDYATRVGCVAAKGNRVIAGAFNTLRNISANVPYGEATMHAEINVLRMLDQSAKITLYIARLNKTGKPMPSRPCIPCMLNIKHSGFSIREIVYMDTYNKVVKERL